MARMVRGALLQATWTGDKESMIQKHEGYAHEAAKQGDLVQLLIPDHGQKDSGVPIRANEQKDREDAMIGLGAA